MHKLKVVVTNYKLTINGVSISPSDAKFSGENLEDRVKLWIKEPRKEAVGLVQRAGQIHVETARVDVLATAGKKG